MLSSYRDTYHLSAHEMDHLRSCLFWGCCEIGNLSASERSAVENAERSADISADIVHHAFCDYVFSDDDFIL